MRTYDEIDRDAKDGSPFSNGTEGYAWQDNWCGRCLVDAPFQRDEKGAEGCPLLLVAFLGKTPSEWLEQPWLPGEDGRLYPVLGDTYHCVEFRDEDGPVDTEPQSIPDPPGQFLLLPREPYEGTRMLTTAPLAAPLTGRDPS